MDKHLDTLDADPLGPGSPSFNDDYVAAATAIYSECGEEFSWDQVAQLWAYLDEQSTTRRQASASARTARSLLEAECGDTQQQLPEQLPDIGYVVCGRRPSVSYGTDLEIAASECALARKLADENTTVVIDTRGDDEWAGESLDDLTCLLRATDAPTRVTARMDATRALDGMQTDSWDGYSATWTFHPDSGVTVIVYET